MDISRGAQRDRGQTTVINELVLRVGSEYKWHDKVRWDPATKKVVIDAGWVRHTDGRTHHNYQIRLSLEDVSALVTILGHAGLASDATLLRDHLGKQVPALVKLLACATGLVPTPMAEVKPGAVKKA
jgi:hypothetical protein